ncbi:MAG: Lpg1974 family pore-forming outer membrane protein, partial [Chlamydiota bacterium]
MRMNHRSFLAFFGLALMGTTVYADGFLWGKADVAPERMRFPLADESGQPADGSDEAPDQTGAPEVGALPWSNQNGSSAKKPVAKANPNGLGPKMFDPNSLQNDCGLWLEGDLLFWQSNVGSLGYAVDSNSTTSISHGHVKDPHFEWDWGFKLGVGYKMPHDKWDLFVNYTYVHAHAQGSTHKENGAVFPVWATSFGFVGPSFYATEAKAHWHANLNMADIELGRTCFAGRWLSMRPFIGVRGLVIDQDYDVKYSGGTAFPGDTDKVSMNTDFWGVGLRVGLDTLWGLGAGFGIYGNGSASLLSGHFDVDEKE